MTTPTPVLPAGLTPEAVQQAQVQLFDQVEAPAWLAKMAEFGFEPSTQDEVLGLLKLGMSMQQIPDDHPYVQFGLQVLHQKQAQQESPLLQLVRNAESTLAAPQPQAPSGPFDSLAKAAEIVQTIPTLAESALIFRTCLEQQAAA